MTAKPIPYLFAPQKTAEPAPPLASANEPEPGLVARAMGGWDGELHTDLTAGEPEADVLRRWATEQFRRVLNLATSLLSRKENEACAAVCDVLLEVAEPDHELMPEVLYYRGTARTNMDAPDHGVPDLTRLVNDCVDHGRHGSIPVSWALNNLAWALYCDGDYETGVLYARRAVEADPKNGPAQSTLAGLLWQTGDPDGALAAFSAGYALGLGPEWLPESMQNDPRLLALAGDARGSEHDDD